MVDFRPFRAVRYAAHAGAAADLICPPYDVIGAEAERELLARNPYNFVRLELTEATDAPDPRRYAAAADAYRAWLAEGVLATDAEPAYYVLRQRFEIAGERLERYAVLGALRLEPLGDGVLPHEDTGAQAKRDRLALMEATAANFSPIMLLYRDQGGRWPRCAPGRWPALRWRTRIRPTGSSTRCGARRTNRRQGRRCWLWRPTAPTSRTGITATRRR